MLLELDLLKKIPEKQRRYSPKKGNQERKEKEKSSGKKREKERTGEKNREKERKKREKREKCPQDVSKMLLTEMLETIDILAEMLKI